METRNLGRRNFFRIAGLGTIAMGTNIASAGANGMLKENLPVAGRYDVIVCGGGTSGLPAAIAAARQGLKVAIIERYGFLGGNPATSIMPTWHKIKLHHSGILTEFANLVKETRIGPNPWENENIEPEAVKILFLKMAIEAGVSLHLHEYLVGVVKDSGVISGVISESKSGRRSFLAKVIVDATGDGDVGFHAGAPHEKGDNGKMQAMSLRFRIGYIDFEKWLTWGQSNLEYFRGAKAEKLEQLKEQARKGLDFYIGTEMSRIWENDPDPYLPKKTYFVASSLNPNELSVNSTRIYNVDGTNSEDLTRAEIETRLQAYSIWNFVRKNIPGFEKSVIIETPVQVGVRETRLTTGDYILTEKDCLNEMEFSDSVMTSRLAFDAHDSEKYTLKILDGLVDVPYRCFLAKNVEGLIIVGRTISTDHMTNSTIRKMESAFQSGEVGGTAAALAVMNNTTPRGLDVHKLQNTLISNGFMTSQAVRMKAGRHLKQLNK